MLSECNQQIILNLITINQSGKRGSYSRSGGEYPNFEGPAQKRFTYTATKRKITDKHIWSTD